MANSPENGKPLYESIRNRWGCCIWSAKNFWTQRQGPPNRFLVPFGRFARCSSRSFCSLFILFGEDRLLVVRWPLLKELSHKNKGNERKEIGNRSNKKCNSPYSIENQPVMTVTRFSNYKISLLWPIFLIQKRKIR